MLLQLKQKVFYHLSDEKLLYIAKLTKQQDNFDFKLLNQINKMHYTYKYQKNKHPQLRNLYWLNIHSNHQIQFKEQRQNEENEKKILHQLSTIDHTLQKSNGLVEQYKHYKGFILSQHCPNQSKEQLEKLVNALEICLKNRFPNVVQNGFEIVKMIRVDRGKLEKNRVKYNSINKILLQKKLPNLRQFDKNGSRANKHKDLIKHYRSQYTTNIKKNPITPIKSIINCESLKYVSRSIQYKHQTDKQHLPSIQQKGIKTNIKNKSGSSRVQTQQSRFSTYETQQIAKNDIRKLLKKCIKIIGVWLSPTTYPQFIGMFSYTTHHNIHRKKLHQKTKYLQNNNDLKKCKLTKYFFYRRSISKRLFEAILDCLSNIQGEYIECLEIITTKDMFVKNFQIIGWNLIAQEANNKVKIEFNRIQS